MSIHHVYQIYGIITYTTTPATMFKRSQTTKHVLFFHTEAEAKEYRAADPAVRDCEMDYFWAINDDDGHTKIISNRGIKESTRKQFEGYRLDKYVEETVKKHMQENERVLIGLKARFNSSILEWSNTTKDAKYFIFAYPGLAMNGTTMSVRQVMLYPEPVIFQLPFEKKDSFKLKSIECK